MIRIRNHTSQYAEYYVVAKFHVSSVSIYFIQMKDDIRII